MLEPDLRVLPEVEALRRELARTRGERDEAKKLAANRLLALGNAEIRAENSERESQELQMEITRLRIERRSLGEEVEMLRQTCASK